MHQNLLIWAIVAVATAAVVTRPFKLPEAIWAVTGAALLTVPGLLPGHTQEKHARDWQKADGIMHGVS